MCDFENDMLKFIFVKTTEKKLVKNFSLEKKSRERVLVYYDEFFT